VTAYFKLIQNEIGINHEDELIRAVTALTEKVHPLALGIVQRTHQQSKMMAKKLLKKHMPSAAQEHEIDTLIEQLKSNLFFHGHPINRFEAKNDLKLKVINADADLEKLMWALYLLYEVDLKMEVPFNVAHEIEKGMAATPPLTVEQIVIQINQILAGGGGINIGTITPQRLVEMATAMLSHLSPNKGKMKVTLDKLPGAYVESFGLTHVFNMDIALEKLVIQTQAGPQEAIKQEIRFQRWEKET